MSKCRVMKSKVLIQQRNLLQLKLLYEINEEEMVPSAQFVINEAVKVQFRVVAKCHTDDHNEGWQSIFFKMTKLRENDDVIYKINFTSKVLNINSKNFFTDDTDWRSIYECDGYFTKSFDVTLEIDIHSVVNTFSTLHDDNELTDFKLCGDNGSVHVHKAVLATCSPALRQMLVGPWKEVSEGCVAMHGVDINTLQHLKEYLYLKKLPESGLEKLLLLASCYMIKDLEERCINNLVRSLTSQTFMKCQNLPYKIE